MSSQVLTWYTLALLIVLVTTTSSDGVRPPPVRCRTKFSVKESQSLVRIPDTLVYAMEFIRMPTPADQAEGLEELRKTVLRLHPELKVSWIAQPLGCSPAALLSLQAKLACMLVLRQRPWKALHAACPSLIGGQLTMPTHPHVVSEVEPIASAPCRICLVRLILKSG